MHHDHQSLRGAAVHPYLLHLRPRASKKKKKKSIDPLNMPQPLLTVRLSLVIIFSALLPLSDGQIGAEKNKKNQQPFICEQMVHQGAGGVTWREERLQDRQWKIWLFF